MASRTLGSNQLISPRGNPLGISEQMMRLVGGEAVAGVTPGASEVGWFAARQPGLVKYLEERLLADDGDAFGVALEAAWRISLVFERRDGVPPPRVTRSLLERAEGAVIREASGAVAHQLDDGCAIRQPELCRWLARYVANPPVPLTAAEARGTGTALAALIYALDELTTGRQVP